MARRPTMTLAALKADKPKPAPIVNAPVTDSAGPYAPTAAPENMVADPRRGQTLRLTVPAWQALKRLAIDEQKTSHELLLEAVNLLFKSKKMPPIA